MTVLQQFLKRSPTAEKGFTLAEMLVVILIVSILAAIALPSYLGQAAKAKQSEAKSYVGAVNRSQQTYRIEHTAFAPTLKALEIGLPTQTIDYKYAIESADGAQTEFTAAPKDPQALRAYAGGVRIDVAGQTSTAACQTIAPSANPPAIVTGQDGGADCASEENIMR
jgi:type IV pilus assembly protein PilA